MSWKVTCAMEERMRFIADHEEGLESFADLCRDYGVSRKTGYKWLGRYRESGLAGLGDASRAPRRHPNEIAELVQRRIIELRAAHPTWGPKKLHAWLERHEAGQAWPAVSTMGAILKRHGLSWARKKRNRASPSEHPLQNAESPNQVWCADYKGWFLCGDQQRCYPLTITDAYSRYLLRCQAMRQTETITARAVFEATFREYGMPQAIRTDNGSPFASVGLRGLSRLSVWWLKLGIQLERIEPGEPQQNGRHERMHRTLKAETTKPAGTNLRAQQTRFDRFLEEFNRQRPHEALNFAVPAERYQASPRVYPHRLEEPTYLAAWGTRRVSSNGEITLDYARLFLTEALAHESVGLEPVGDGLWRVWFGSLCLGEVNQRRDWPGTDARRSRWLKLQSPSRLLPLEPTSIIKTEKL